MRKFLFLGLLAAAASPLPAQQLPVPAPMAPMAMGKTVTRAEVQTRVQAQFAKRDANRDGVLTTDELQRGGRRMMAMGRGGDMAEQMAGRRGKGDANAVFDRMDANRDGSISREEFARNRIERMERRMVINQSGAPGMDRGQMGAMRGNHRGMGAMGGAMLKMADANRDGRVTLAEATSGALRHFDMMDSNRDGRLTPEERAAGRVRMIQMRRAG